VPNSALSSYLQLAYGPGTINVGLSKCNCGNLDDGDQNTINAYKTYRL